MNLSEVDTGVIRNEVKRALEQLIMVEEHLQAIHEAVILEGDYRVEFESFRIDYPIKDAARWKAPEMQERIETIRSSLNAIEKRLVVGEAKETNHE